MPALFLPSATFKRGICVTGLLVIFCIALLPLQKHYGAFDRLLAPTKHFQSHVEEHEPSRTPAPVAMVVASRTIDNTSWLHNVFPEWEKNIYVTDDSKAGMSVPAHKGREGMVYLTYIIDHYDILPELMIFQHANRYQWHNDDPLYDGVRILSRLRLSYVHEQGYVNLRCVWTLGCPVEILPFEEEAAPPPATDPHSNGARAGSFYKQAFEVLFPDVPVPRTIGASCCAQFAVTAQRVRARPKQDYERYRQWLIETDLRDDLSGRIIEYTWHIIFGQNAVDCPNAQECYRKLYGLHDLECQSEGICKSQYTLPRWSFMPKGWPDYDWDGRWQNASAK